MVAYCKPPAQRLVLTFERDGEEPIQIEARHGRLAKTHAVNLLLKFEELQPGDVLRITSDD